MEAKIKRVARDDWIKREHDKQAKTEARIIKIKFNH